MAVDNQVENTQDDNPTLLAVFRDQSTAQRARDDLAERGVQAELGGEAAVRDELRAEMREETEGLMAGPGAPVHTKEMLLGSVPATIGLSALGAVLFAILAWFIEIPDVSFLQRVIWFAVIGAVAFGTVAYLLGGALGSRMANKIPAAQRGTTLVVHDGSQATADLLTEHDPIRVDRRDGDGTTTPVVTEDELHDDLTARHAAAQVRGTDRADD